MSSASGHYGGGRVVLALRYALRELRGGLQGFYVFIACIALGVMAISGVGSLAASLSQGLAHEGRILLGGDASFMLFQREASPAELAFLRSRGQVSVVASLRTMARAADGKLALVDVKAVDSAYPMLGALTLAPRIPMADLFARRDGVFGAAADPTLMARLDLKIGDKVRIGNATFQIRSADKGEPDKFAGGIALAPRFLINIAALRATGLLQPGSLVRWTYRVKLPGRAATDRAVASLIAAADKAAPQAGWQVHSRNKATPQLSRNIRRFTQFLTLVGLTALLVGGVGVANAVKSHIDRRLEVIAALKAVGAIGRDVFAIYLAQVMLLAGLGSLIGLAVGAALPFVVADLFGRLLPLPLAPALHPDELALAFVYGILTALAFGLWPLGRVHDAPVASLFRDRVSAEWHRPRWPYLALMALAIALLVAVVIGLADDKRIAAIFVVASVLVFALLRIVAAAMMAAAARLPRSRLPMLRLAISNIYRPGALTPSVVLSLGLGLAVLVTITQIDGNLHRQFTASLPARAPSFFFIDIPSADAGRFAAFLKHVEPHASVEDVPMLRGRIVAARGVRAEDLHPSADAAWVLRSDRGLTYTGEIPKGSRIVEGQWWGANYNGPPLVSIDKRIADGLGLKLGDEIVVNVLGRDISAKIANMRKIDWQSFGINFVLVYSPRAFAGAPHTHVATLTEAHPTASGDGRIVRDVADAFPMVTSVQVREVFETIAKVVGNLMLAIRGASAVTLIAAILVLGGALAAGHRHRLYDAVILKTLGATRAQLLWAYALEYLMIGLATAIFGVVAGSVAAYLIMTRLMTLSFAWQGGSAAGVAAGALVITVGLGLAGTLLALNRKPAAVLRNL